MPKSAVKRKPVEVDKEKNELEFRKFILERQKIRLEEDKSWFEFHKHMTTLNTGVIIIIATLVEKVFTKIDSQGPNLITLSFYAFLVSITLSAIGLGYHLPSLRSVRISHPVDVNRKAVVTFHLLRYVKEFLLITSLLGFLLGILFFISFALGNS